MAGSGEDSSGGSVETDSSLEGEREATASPPISPSGKSEDEDEDGTQPLEATGDRTTVLDFAALGIDLSPEGD
jgi:hypothetical protein